MNAIKALFNLGTTMATIGALKAMADTTATPSTLLDRHVAGDWGDLCEEDKQSNDAALKGDGRIFSSYIIGKNVKIWVITEWDRSATTLLLPSEY